MPAKMPGRPSRGTGDASAEIRALFGTNFRQARLKADLTQAEIEVRTGIRQHYISEIENGAHNVTLDTMTVLARAIDSDIRTLLKPSRRKR